MSILFFQLSMSHLDLKVSNQPSQSLIVKVQAPEGGVGEVCAAVSGEIVSTEIRGDGWVLGARRARGGVI